MAGHGSRGQERHGRKWRVEAQPGRAGRWFGMTWSGSRGGARCGVTWSGPVRSGQAWPSRHGAQRQLYGSVGHGRFGVAVGVWPGPSRSGSRVEVGHGESVKVRPRWARQVPVGPGKEGLGAVGHGSPGGARRIEAGLPMVRQRESRGGSHGVAAPGVRWRGGSRQSRSGVARSGLTRLVEASCGHGAVRQSWRD